MWRGYAAAPRLATDSLQPPIDGRAVHAEYLRGRVDLPSGLVEHLEQRSLEKSPALPIGRLPRIQTEHPGTQDIGTRDQCIVRQGSGALDDRLQLAHIPRPCVRLEQLNRIAGQETRLLARATLYLPP